MERRAFRVSGFLMLLVIVVEVTLVVLLNIAGTARPAVNVLGALVFATLVSGFVVVPPNEARVLLFFGRYVGSVDTAGFHWTVPFSVKRRISMRVRNFESNR